MTQDVPPPQPRTNSEFYDGYLIETARRWGLDLSPQNTRELDLIGQLHSAGYEARPRLLAEHHAAGDLSAAALNYLVPSTWRYRLDHDCVPIETWRTLFAATDYTHQFCLAQRPRWPLRLYRGATDANRYGLAWTWRVDQASYFARSRQAPGTHARVWTVLAPPSRLLAYLNDEGEYVTDVRGLDVQPYDPGIPLPWWTRRWPHRRGQRPFAWRRAREPRR